MLQLNSISVFCICLVFALGFGHPLTAQSNRKAKQALEKAFQNLQNGAESQAIAGFQQALQLDSTLHEARIALGDLSRKKRSYADAVEHYESVIRGNASLA